MRNVKLQIEINIKEQEPVVAPLSNETLKFSLVSPPC